MDSIACPVCGSTETIDCGPPAHRKPLKVAGVPIDLSDLPLRHQRCPVCEYQFVYPRIPESRLIDCYSRSVNQWGTGDEVAKKRFYDHKKQLLEDFAPARSALDFGCYSGGFLEYLGPEWAKAGIEPSTHAAEIARSRGVEIIGPTPQEVDMTQHASKFGAAVIFDVMEHLINPVADLARLRDLLMPKGIMLIETGNTDSPDWQRFGNRHPYCGIVEHVGFFNRKSIETAGALAGLKLVHFEESMHFEVGRGAKRFWRWVWAYRILRLLVRLRIPLPKRLDDIASGPVPRSTEFSDHFLAILQKD
ncbi:MAG TPA: class I SAM-dependent methyltransferase [Tepidisphaeraceae bacterium]|jgi:SAM-dependent methyltransferase|nr:class I SAM-dependent methyltransferase [Tepidisphaeraceae bacterium]